MNKIDYYINSLFEDSILKDNELDEAIENEKNRRGINEGWFANYKAKKQNKKQLTSYNRQTDDINSRLNKLKDKQNTLDKEKSRRSQMVKSKEVPKKIKKIKMAAYSGVNPKSNTPIKTKNKTLLKKPRDNFFLKLNQDKINSKKSFYNKAKKHIKNSSIRLTKNNG